MGFARDTSKDFHFLLDCLNCAAEVSELMNADLDEAAMNEPEVLESLAKSMRSEKISLETKLLYYICRSDYGDPSQADVRMLSKALLARTDIFGGFLNQRINKTDWWPALVDESLKSLASHQNQRLQEESHRIIFKLSYLTKHRMTEVESEFRTIFRGRDIWYWDWKAPS